MTARHRAERKQYLGIPARQPFLEESTYWSPAWTLARGAVQTTSLRDLTRTAILAPDDAPPTRA